MKRRKSLDFLNSKRGNSKFTAPEQESILKAAHAFNQRATQVKKDTGLVLSRVSETEIRKNLQKGMTKNDFLKNYGVIVTDYYSKDGGVQTTNQKIDDVEFTYRKRLGPNRYDIYGKDIYDKLLNSVERAKEAGITDIPFETLPDLTVKSILEVKNYNPYEIEKISVLLNSLASSKSIAQLIQEGKELKQSRRSEELREQTKELLRERGKGWENEADKVDEMDEESLLKSYSALVGQKYKDIDSKYHSPGYFTVKDKEEKREVLDFMNKKAYRDSILSELTDTDYYVDNYFRALDAQEDIKHSRAIMKLLSKIDKDKLRDFLLEDDLKLERWYRTDDSAHEISREQLIVNKIEELYNTSNFNRYFNFRTDKEKAAFESNLQKLKDKIN